MKFNPDIGGLYYPACGESTKHAAGLNKLALTEFDLQMLRLNGVKTTLPNGVEIGNIRIDV